MGKVIPPTHSDLDCSYGHWAFHRNIQIFNAHMGIGHSTGAFRFSMLSRALVIPPEHSVLRCTLDVPTERSDFECSYAYWAFTGTFDAQIGRSSGAFRFPMLIWALGIPPEHYDFQCSDNHWAFHRSSQCSDVHWTFHRSIQI